MRLLTAGRAADPTAPAMAESSKQKASGAASVAHNPLRILLPVVVATAVGHDAQINVSIVNATGAVVPTSAVRWITADPTIARIDSRGMVSPVRVGFTTATASYKGVSATTVVSVRGIKDLPTRSRHAGANLGGLAYYGTNFPFCDLMKSGGGWWSHNADGSWNQPFSNLNARGEPTALLPGQSAAAAVAWSDGHLLPGLYTILWDGDGTLGFPLTNAVIRETAPHRLVIELSGKDQQVYVSIEKTNPADPVRNVRFLLPGTVGTCATQPFNVEYLKRVASFSVLRMMDWGRTNGSPVAEWADRAHVEDAAYTTARGVPIELMIDIANTLHADPWFNVPHMASDDYVRKFAALVHARLDPTLRPRIEYSNEMWNWGFGQIQWGIKQSKAQGLTLPFGMPAMYHAKRSVEIFRLMREEFGPDADRIVRILAGQAAWTQFIENALSYGDTAKNIDAISIAPYFNAPSAADPKNVAISRTITPEQLVDEMLANVRGPVKKTMVTYAALAAKHHVGLTVYEGGMGDHTVPFGPADQKAMTELFSAAARHPRMKELYNEYLTTWTDAGGELLNQYFDIGGWSKFGFWGLLESVNQAPESSPRYQGVLQFINAHPAPPEFSLTGTHACMPPSCAR